MFGFINQRRVVLALHYTHDKVNVSGDCADHTQPIGNTPDGDRLFCKDVVHMCGDPRHGQVCIQESPESHWCVSSCFQMGQRFVEGSFAQEG